MEIENMQRLPHRGPVDPVHGFPLWYEDGTERRLELGLAPDPLTPAVGDYDPSAPLAIPGNFPDEAFYFLAESRMDVTAAAGGAARARLVLALEAAFGGAGDPRPGMQVVFARIRVRIDDVVPLATYVVTHPYGVTPPLPADDKGRVFWTLDLGLADGDPDAVLRTGQVAPFLVGDGAPAGYLGDGVSQTTVTGSPFGTNLFRIDGPGIGATTGPRDPADPGNPDRVVSTLFTVQGKLATRLGAQLDAATYTRAADGTTTLDVHATSAPGQTLQTAGPGLPLVTLAARDRAYTGRVAVPAPPAPGSMVAVVNATDRPTYRATAPVTDRVDFAQASFDLAAQRLTVSATSSDMLATLTLDGHDVTTVPTVLTGIAAVPAEVEVVSSAGGRARRRVTLTGATQPDEGLVADPGPARSVIVGRELTLDGTGSRGLIGGYAWTVTAGSGVTIADAGAAQTTATFAAEGPVTLRLTVTGAAGTATADLPVTVGPVPPPDQLTIDKASYRTGTRQFRIDGTQSGIRPALVTVRFRGEELGRGAVDATGAWSVRHTLTAAQAHLRPTTGAPADRLTATTEHGGDASAPVAVRG